jgi:hypothetical protein
MSPHARLPVKDSDQAGGLALLANHSTAGDLKQLATILVSMKWHFKHSNMRFSEPSLRHSLLSNAIPVWQR